MSEKLSILDQNSLIEFFEKNKIPKFRIKQIYKNIFSNSILDFDDMTDLSIELRNSLKVNFDIIPFELDQMYENEDSCKFGFKLPDGKIIETVLMLHWHYHDSKDISTKFLNRLTICISSQVGCPVGCIFCVTGKLWFGKNLDYANMIWQILWVNNYIKTKLGKKEDGTQRKVRNVVFMWMWEPLLNYENVKQSVAYMLWQEYLWLGKRHVTISTSGIIKWIDQMIDDNLWVMLALSLHAPNQILREKLIPTISKIYDLDSLMESVDRYTSKTWNRVFYEYIMIEDMTDKIPLAHQLVDLLKFRNAHVNLIPYNPNPAMPELFESKKSQILAFRDICESGWLTLTVRDNHGRDIKWACGQLWFEKVNKGEKVSKR